MQYKLIKEWKLYKKFLQDKYPVENGQKWEFTCEHHKKLDAIIQYMGECLHVHEDLEKYYADDYGHVIDQSESNILNITKDDLDALE